MKTSIFRILIIICAVVWSLGACANKGNEASSKETEQNQQSSASMSSQVTESDAPLVMNDKDKLCVDKNNELAFTLLQKQSKKEPYKSFTFSPLSVSCALAMTSNGASGATLKEIEALVGTSAAANSFYGKCLASFAPLVEMSNYLAMNKSYPVNQEFIKSIEGVYNAQVSNLNFGTDEATNKINDWIKQQSGGEFSDIIKQTNVNEIAYLINYMKFKALWNGPFDQNLTYERDFTNDDGTITQVPMMFQYFSELYYEDNKCQAVSKKYAGGRLRMLIVLPKDTKISNFLAAMNADEFNRIISGFEESNGVIDLSLPRFSTDCSLDVREMLLDLMPTAFDEKADFSRLSKAHSYINRFTQDTKITVNEYGTEASSVTVQSFLVKAEHPQFTANHPFLYFVYNEDTNAILLAGQFCGDGFKTTESRNSRNVTANDSYDASDDGIFNSCAQMPHFPGGDGALMRFINDNLKYPPEAFENRIEGKVIIQFVVTKTGKVGQVRVARAVNRDLDREAIRLCKMLPDFTPGRNALGEPVSVWYTLPVSFKLPNNN
ncbi:MAG: TonB family protein [Muribaculaceae bacterium]|nr:TonB family protein [Muribaculaceae bacterium]